MLKIGIESSAYFSVCGNSWRRGLSRMRSHGYEGMDFRDFIRTENNLMTAPEDEFKSRLSEFRDAAREEGIEISLCHGPWRWPICDSTEEERMERFSAMSRAIRGAAVMGCPNIALHPIMPYGVMNNPEINPEGTLELNYEFYSKLTRVASDEGVTICLENMPFKYFSLSRTSDVLDMVKRIDSPNLRVCVDTGHSAIFTNPADDIRLVGKEYLRAVHLHDNGGRNDDHNFPYHGIIDWNDVTAALREVEFSGLVNLETFVKGHYPADIKEGFEIGLAKIARRIADMIEGV